MQERSDPRLPDTAADTLTAQLQTLFEAEPGLKQALYPNQEAPQIVALLDDAARRHSLRRWRSWR